MKNKQITLNPNFRPISVLPVLSKVIERHVHDSLYSYLTENNLIYPRQSGFRKNHSTDTALIQIIDELSTQGKKDQGPHREGKATLDQNKQ